jgi:uncharacterized protein (DUF362 family)
VKSRKHISRKSFLLKVAGIASGLLIAPFYKKITNIFMNNFANAASAADDRVVVLTAPDITKESIEKMVDKAFNQFGGITEFIKKGMNVVIKPNIGWNAAPERAANTNPILVETVARLCKEAGAKVTIFDNTCDSERLCYKNSGIEKAAENAGAKLEFIDDRKFVNVKVPDGLFLNEVSVYKPILDADFVINMPIAKHHSSSQLTISMKNLMGVIKHRGQLHISLHKGIVDLSKVIRSDLVICDCLRILTNHGPNAGMPEDVKETRTIIMGRNSVTVDAYAATLFGKSPSDIKYLSLAYQEKMGEINIAKMNLHKFSV